MSAWLPSGPPSWGGIRERGRRREPADARARHRDGQRWGLLETHPRSVQATHAPLRGLPRGGRQEARLTATKPLQLKGTSIGLTGVSAAALRASWREVLPTSGLQCGKYPLATSTKSPSPVCAVPCAKTVTYVLWRSARSKRDRRDVHQVESFHGLCSCAAFPMVVISSVPDSNTYKLGDLARTVRRQSGLQASYRKSVLREVRRTTC